MSGADASRRASLHVSRDGGGARAASSWSRRCARGARRVRAGARSPTCAHRGEVFALPRRQRHDARSTARPAARRSPSTPRRRRCCATPTAALALSDGRFDLTSGVLRARVGFPRAARRCPDAGELARRARADRLGARRVGRRARPAAACAAWRSISAASARSTPPIAWRRSAPSTASRTGSSISAATCASIGAPARRRAVARRHPPSAHADARRSAASTCVDGAVATSGDYERFFEIDGAATATSSTRAPAAGRRTGSRSASSRRCAIVAGSFATIAMLLEGQARGVSGTQQRALPAGRAPTARSCAPPGRAGRRARQLSSNDAAARRRPARIGHAPI